MTVIVGGHETGLLDTSLALLNRNDRSGNTEPGHGEQPYVNVSNGNLLIQQVDAFLPSLGEDYLLARTYNVRGRPSDAHQHDDARWIFSTSIRLDVRHSGGNQYFQVEFGDGSFFEYWLDNNTGLYVSTDGAGAYGVIEDLGTNGNNEPSYVLTRADQSRLSFDSQGRLLQLVDTNGVTVDYIYASDRLVQVLDDQGHVLNYIYQNGVLFQVTDENEGVLVEYRYTNGRLSEVIDRYGHSTQYFYTNDGYLNRIVLPGEQIVDGQLETYGAREVNFEYETIIWNGSKNVVTQITDAQGGITTFEYDFDLVHGNGNQAPGPNPPGNAFGIGNGNGPGNGNGNGNNNGGNVYLGGSTRVVDALGNNRAFSNDQQYADWRTDNGYYAVYDENQAANNAGFASQVDAIRTAHALNYTYDEDGYITGVIDQQGFHTSYVYDEQNNLISVTDRNGWGATNSDSNYYRALRAELGYVDGAGNGQLVAMLNPQEVADILEAFTTHFEYDDSGNLIRTTDNEDNVTTLSYTSFNKLESSTSAVGNALVTSDEQIYQDLRVELGYAALVSNLSAADVQAILDLHTTFFVYDANQNLIERSDAGGDLTRFEYDSFGNLVRRIVFLDANDLVDPAKQQITTFAYDGFGNNVSTTDAEGNQAFSVFDHFGNRTQFTDGRGGVTQFTYDADNRLLTVTDPEGDLTINTYDAVGNRTSITDANGHTITRIYDLNNNLIANIDPSDFDPADDRVTSFEYDVVGNRTATVDAQGRRTEYTFNARRETVEALTEQVEDQNGSLTRYQSTIAYDGESNRIAVTNNRGNTTEYLYTRNNLVQQQTDANGHITRFEYDANLNQVSIIIGVQLAPALRQIVQYRFDEEDQLVRQTDAEGNQTGYVYDAPGNRLAVTDANGNTTDFEFDRNNRLVREIRPEVIDPVSGLAVRYSVDRIYDANGNEIETIDENGNSTTFTFDADDKLLMVEDGNGIKTVFEYDSRHNRTTIVIGADATVDATGNVIVGNVDAAQITRFVYDEFNQLTARTDGSGNALAESDAALYQALRMELGYAPLVADLSAADKAALRNLHTEHFSYDRVGNLLTETDNLGRTTTFDYDALNRKVSVTDALGQVRSNRYDGNGNLTSTTDELGRVTTFEFDSVGQVTDLTDPIGAATHFVYDDFGNLTTSIKAFGTAEARATTFEYDLNNRLIAEIDPEAHTRSFEYDAVGNRIRLTDARGNAAQFFFNALNRNVRILDPLSFETRFEYDGVGNQIAIIDARAGISRLAYDPGNRLISTTDAEGRVSEFTYDVRGNRIELRTGAGTPDEELTVFEYDAVNNLRRILDAEGGVTDNDFDRVYNQISTTDANGHTSHSQFDALNRRIQFIDAESQITQFAYDAVDNNITRTDALGRTTSFVYDANNRQIREVAADGVETHFAYDIVGNQISITRAANTADAATDTFVYDLDDRLVSQTNAEGNTSTFVYDENDNQTVVTDANGNVTVFSYDANDQVVQVVDAEGNTVLFSYDGNGNRTQVVDGRGNAATTYYNANNEVSIAVDPEGFATSFVYDNNGNVTSRTLHMQPLAGPVNPAVEPTLPVGPADQTILFEYDQLNRVTGRIDAEGYRTEFVYDAVGNRLQTRQFRDLAGTDIAVTRSYYDDVNRAIARVTAEGYLTETLYDAVGNVVQATIFNERVTAPPVGVPVPQPGDTGRVEAFEYDLVNRLVRAINALGVEVVSEYDDRGNLTALIEAAGTGSARRSEYLYDRADRLTDTIDALGAVTHFTLDANGNVVTRFDAFGTVDERQTTYSYDANNRTVTATDSIGVVTQFSYDANGSIVAVQYAVGLAETRTETREYDANDRVIAEVNGEGERVEFDYDGAGNRVTVVEAPGLAEERTAHFEFDRDNRLVAQIDGEGVRTEFRYDGADNRIETIQATGVAGQERHSFQQYDLDNRLLQTIDPLGGVVQFEYDVLGNRTSVTDQNGGVQTNTYDIVGRLVTSLSAGGTLTQNTYGLRGNLLSRETSFANGSDSRLSVYEYDILDRQIRVTNANGYSTESVFDVFGNQVQTTRGLYLVDPLSPDYDPVKAALANPQTTLAAYDAVNRLVSLTDAQGIQHTSAYDAVGNRISEIAASNVSGDRITTFTYDLANRLVETVNPEGGITRNSYDELGQLTLKSLLQSDDGAGTQIWIDNFFEYDDNGRIAARTDGEGVRFEFAYDAVGNEIGVRSAVGSVDERLTQTEYDLNNRIVAVTDGEGNRSEFAYDSIGNRIQLTDARGNAGYFYYDADNRQVSVLNSEGYISEQAYDSAGNRVELREFFSPYAGPIDPFGAPLAPTSALDRVTSFVFDGEGRQTSRVEADGATYQFAYDGVGNLAGETDALGRQTAYNYDLNNRLTVRTAADGVETHYGYDAVGNRTSIVNAANTADVTTELFVYDLNNRLVQEIDGLGNAWRTLGYDRADNQVSELDANGNERVYAYDLNNRLTDYSDGIGNISTYVYDDLGNIRQEIDARGNAEIKFYNDNDQVSLRVDREGFVTAYQYDANGNVVSQTLHMTGVALPVDPNVLPTIVPSASDQTTTFEYDALDRVVARTDGEGYRTEFVYDAAGNQILITQFRDLAGTDVAAVHRYFDALNREVARISAEGYLTTFGYDAVGNRIGRVRYDLPVAIPAAGLPTAQPGDNGRVEAFIYDAADRLVQTSSALGVDTIFEYDDRGNRTATVEAAGTAGERITANTYDAANRLIDSINALGVVTRFSYDANGNVVEQRDALGTPAERLSIFAYDGNDRLVRETNAIGVVTDFAYDANGNLLSVTDAFGLPEVRTRQFEYDRNNRATADINGEGERSESAYDGAGNRVSLTLAPGLAEQRINTFEFDRDNRLVAAVDGEGVRTEYRYDGDDNKIQTIQAAGLAGQERNSFYEYDLDNRLLQVVDPLGATTQYEYDAIGNQTRIVNANGNVQTSTFDALGRLLSTISSGGILTTNTYDVRGNIVSTAQSFADTSDARTTSYGYDLLDRQTLVTDPEGFSTRIQYDAFDNQVLIAHGQYLPQPGDAGYDAGKAARAFVQTNVFVYDAADRLVNLTDAEGNITTYGYDGVGNQVAFTEAANSAPRTTVYVYDRADRLLETISPEGGVARNTYDEAGNRVAESVLQSDDGVTQVWSTTGFEYDANANVTAQIDALGVRTEFDYDAMGNQTVLRFAAGTADQRINRQEYDLNNRVSAAIDGEGNRTEFDYDSLGNRVRVTDALGRVARFYFDGSNNLVSILDAEGYINEFNYDSAGNRTGESIYQTRYTGTVDDFVAPTATPSANDRVFASTYDGNNRVISRLQSDDSVTTYEYDAAGNLLTETRFAASGEPRVVTYSYDLNNRLLASTDVDGSISSFAYDGANNKISETITNVLDPNSTRTTIFEYDLNNRLIRETFDPAGLNLVQIIEYDRAGNAIANSDANGNTTRAEYDLNNRVVRQIDALNNDTLLAYDAVGNQISLTDANGNVRLFEYDGNNRLILETLPTVSIHTIARGNESLALTISRQYDAAGNEVQIVDPAGNVTTRYFDANDRLVAEINGNNVLTEFEYNASGELISEKQYMTPLTAAAQDPSVRPAPPAGDIRSRTFAYDLGGRILSITHSAMTITTLVDADTANPTIATETRAPVETFSYDAFGNQIEAIDRNGNRTVTYYDVKGRIVAQVDGFGYLTEFDYDAQDNVIEQRLYTGTLDVTILDPGVPLAPPAGDVYQTNRIYDAASRLIEEHSPQIEVFNPATLTTTLERVVTRFGYDGVGNQISRTLAAGSAQQFTEYTYFDALNRQVALVDGNRVVNLFGYDANGNQTLARRYFNIIAGAVDLTTLTGQTNFAALVGSNSNDQQINRFYDALDRLSSQTELMGPGAGDDLTESFAYDENGNRSREVDEDGFVQRYSFDALGNLIRSESPDMSGTVYEYNAAGEQIFAFTGQLDSTPLPASNLTASLGESLTFGWMLPSGGNVQSYVVYDTQSHSDPQDYASQTPVMGTWLQTQASTSIPTGGFGAGDTVYFRVVTQDIAGSFTWTAEQVVTLPPRIEDIAVAQTGTDTFEITVQFDAATVNPQIVYGMPGSTNTPATLVDLGGGLYRATLTGISNPQELAYRVNWEDGGGQAFASDEIPFEAQGEHLGVTSQLSESTVVIGPDTFYRANIDTSLPSDFAADLLSVSATWVNTADSSINGSASVEGVDSGLGFFDFPIVVGAGDNPLVAGTYLVTLRAVGETDDTILDAFEITVGGGLLSGTERSVSWTAPSVGDAQVVIVDGQRVDAVREGDRLVADAGLSAPGSVAFSAFYGTAFSDMHTTTITSTEQFDIDNGTMPPTVTSLGFDLAVLAQLTAAETANVAGDVHLAWRAAGSGTEFPNDVALTANVNDYDTTLPLLAAGAYDLKIYYTDVNGDEVIVDWLRVDTATASTVIVDNSVAIGASEVDGEISLSVDDVLSVDPGLYSGPLAAGTGELSLAATLGDTTVDAVQVDGQTAGYSITSQYDALGNLIATNAETGVWREFGVDANGNRVVTSSSAAPGAPNAIVTLTAYDARNREIAQFGAEVNGQRSINRIEYDVNDNVTVETDPLGGTTQRGWNALGSQISATDELNNVRVFRYDRLGRNTAEIDAIGNTRYKFYDTVGNLVQTIDGEGNSITHSYDAFGRQIQSTNALNQSADRSYDQRDRLVSVTDALGLTTSYEYDGRDNRTRTVDANNHESRQVWDGLGRVSDTVTIQNGQEIHERKQYDAYGNLVASIDGAGRITTSAYGQFGRLLQRIDSGGRITTFEYDDQGRVIRERGLQTGKDIQRTYDDAGRLVEVDDVGTGVRTTYTYDLAGKRLSEVTVTPGNAHNRNVTYQYDAVGQMLRWADSVTGMHTNYMWDAAGNLARAFTDLGYDPDNEGLGAATRFVDHDYSYDGNNLISSRTQRGAIEIQYGYDAAGNRMMVNNAGTITTYEFDANGRVIRAESGGQTTADWIYDNVGNVTRFRSYSGGSVDKVVSKTYYENNRNWFTNDDGQQTTLTLDRAGNVLRTKLVDDGDTFFFDHAYNASGQETSIRARGDDIGGNTTNSYDANDQLTELNKGEGDNQDRPEILRFVYNNDGKIIYRFNDTGEGSDIFETEFAYANGNPVGQTGETEDAASETLLDTGKYNLVKDLDEDFPSGAVTFVTASAGDTLQGIAAAVYGNPSLWFVLAEANGIAPDEALTEGQRLQIPNTIKTGTLTADTHVVYDEGDIIGSTLPNLKSEPKDGGCGGFLAIIIVAIIAVVAVVLTGPLAAAILPALGATTATTTILSFAIAGAILGAAASIVQQGLFIALGYQDEFSWKAVAAGAASGFFQAAGTGLGKVVQAAAAVGDTIKFAKTAAAALKIASVASKQLIENGKITSWTSLAAAGISGALSVSESKLAGIEEARNTEGLSSSIADNVEALAKKTILENRLETLQTAVAFITPWIQLAETSIRNDGELTPADWVSAVGNSLSGGLGKVIDNNDNIVAGLDATAAKIGANLAIGGALSLYDRDAALDFISNSVGNEIGNFIGGAIADVTGARKAAEAADAKLRKDLADTFRKPELTPPNPLTMLASLDPMLPQFDGPSASSGDDLPIPGPGDANESTVLSAFKDNDGDVVQVGSEPYKVAKDDSFYVIAKAQLEETLDRDPTPEEIQRQTQILMGLNPNVNPRSLQIGSEIQIVAPFSGMEPLDGAVLAFQEDAQYQEYLIAEAEREAALARAEVTQALATPATGPVPVSSAEVQGAVPVAASEQGTEKQNPLELIILGLQFGETFADGRASLTADQFAAREFTEQDLVFGILTQVAINSPPDQFAANVQQLGLDPKEAELALSIIFGQEPDFSGLGPLTKFVFLPRSGIAIEQPSAAAFIKDQTLKVQEQFEAGELTRREVIEQLVFKPAESRASAERLTNRLFGGLSVVGGVIEVVAGVALSETGIGALIGVPLAGLGVDNFQTGVRQVVSGEATKSLLQTGLEEVVGLSETGALIGSILINLGVGLTASAAQAGKLGKFGQAARVGVADDVLEGGASVLGKTSGSVADEAADVLTRSVDDVARNFRLARARTQLLRTRGLDDTQIREVSRAIRQVGGRAEDITDARFETLVSNFTFFVKSTQGLSTNVDELPGLVRAIKQVEGQGFELLPSLKSKANQGIDLFFKGVTESTSGRFAVAEAKAGKQTAETFGTAAGPPARQGSFDFLFDRFSKVGGTKGQELVDALNRGQVDSYFSNSRSFLKFDLSTYTSGVNSAGRNIDFRTTQGRALFERITSGGN